MLANILTPLSSHSLCPPTTPPHRSPVLFHLALLPGYMFGQGCGWRGAAVCVQKRWLVVGSQSLPARAKREPSRLGDPSTVASLVPPAPRPSGRPATGPRTLRTSDRPRRAHYAKNAPPSTTPNLGRARAWPASHRGSRFRSPTPSTSPQPTPLMLLACPNCSGGIVVCHARVASSE